ncbi:DUF4339 domain-containing protein [Flaviaesturariibacter terrae]
MTHYYVHNGQAQAGPYSIDELKAKSIGPDTQVWTEGMSGWQRAGDVDELKVLFASVPPPFEPAPASATPPPFTKPAAKPVVPPKKRRRLIGA